MLLGLDAFVEAMRCRIPEPGGPARGDLSEIPQARARPWLRPIAEHARACADRDGAIAAGYAVGGHTMKDVADHFGLHYSQVGRIVRVAERAKRKT